MALLGQVSANEFKYARINATVDGDNTVVAAVAGKQIAVLAYAFAVSAAGTVKLQDTAGTPEVHGEFPLAANGGVSYAGGLSAPAFETDLGTGVEVNVAVGQDALGHLTYVEL